MMDFTNKSFAEIVSSSLERCTAQTWRWDDIPLFGSLMTIQDPDYLLFGLVCDIHIGSADASRMPFTYQKTPEELLRDQPQIFAFLKTTFSCLIVGYVAKNSIIYTLAPKPARIHAFVQLADAHYATQFFSTTAYLYSLFGVHHSSVILDELLLAIFTHNQHYIPPQFLRDFMRAYITLIGNDYKRIRLFSRRISTIQAAILFEKNFAADSIGSSVKDR